MDDCMMPVTVDGKVETRRVASTGSILHADGSEVECIRYPELFHGESAIYYLDGRPPAITQVLVD